jgi:hypothetical protein
MKRINCESAVTGSSQGCAIVRASIYIWTYMQHEETGYFDNQKRCFTPKCWLKTIATKTRQLCQRALQIRTHHFAFEKLQPV